MSHVKYQSNKCIQGVFYIHLIVKKSHEKTKTNYALVRLATPTDFLSVALVVQAQWFPLKM